MVGERADEADLFLEELLVVGHLQHHRAEEPVVRDQRHRDVIERDDRPALGDGPVRGVRCGALQLTRARALAILAVLAKENRTRRAGVDAHQAVDDKGQHLIEIEGRCQHVRDLEERGDLAELAVGLALQTPLLDDPRDLVRDRLQEVDLLADEIARLHRLNVHDADYFVARDHRDGEHRREALLVHLRDPLPARLRAHVACREGHPRIRDPPHDALAESQRSASDAAAIQSIRRDEPQHTFGSLEEIQR